MPQQSIISDFDALYAECGRVLDAHQAALARECPRTDVLLARALFLWDEVVAWLDRLPLTEEEKIARLVRLSTCRAEAGGLAAPAPGAGANGGPPPD